MDLEDKMDAKRKEKAEQTSHKLIEKRRRDRINNCLAELSQAVPAAFAKQSTGKLEKAEILEMTVEYLRAIQATEIGSRFENGEWFSSDIWGDFIQHYQTGYSDCMKELIRYMTEVEHVDTGDSRCVRILSYLQTRFRPDNSVNSGTVYRDSLTRSAATPVQRQHATSSHSQPTNRGHHRFSPYSLPSSPSSSRTNDLLSTKVEPLSLASPSTSSASSLASLVNFHRSSPGLRQQAHGIYGLGSFDRLLGVAPNGPASLHPESRVSAFTRQIQK